MRPKFICDSCEESLKEKDEEGDCLYLIENHIEGIRLMNHNNIKKGVIFCEGCFEEFKQNLVNQENWSELQYLDTGYRDFYEYDDLKKEIENEKTTT